jgi:hypothetical protein
MKRKSEVGALSPVPRSAALATLGTNVPSTPSPVVGHDLIEQFNELHKRIMHQMPEAARAYETLHRHLPLLRQMQRLLSQRPKPTTFWAVDFRMLQEVQGKKKRLVMQVSSMRDIPSWTQWISEYARAIDYSVRQIRRLILNETPKKFVKQCGWSQADHNHLIRAATAAFDLVSAIEARADTTALCEEIREIMQDRGDLTEKHFEYDRRPVRRRKALQVTGEMDDFK